MPVAQACPVRVTGAMRPVLTRRAWGHKTPYRDKIRAQIVLLAARRWPNTRIAAELGIAVDTVRTWRGRVPWSGNFRDRERCLVRALKGMSGTPTSRCYVRPGRTWDRLRDASPRATEDP
jgi:hypothetical protein